MQGSFECPIPLPRRLLIAIAFLVLAVATCPSLAQDEPPNDETPNQDAHPRIAAVIEFSGDIHSLSEQYLYRKLEEARKLGARVTVIEIDSPGGDVEATLRIAERLRNLPWAETVAYVPREALSGAALFSLGCDQILMAPQAVIGDAGPIFLDKDFLFKHASEKVRSHLARQVRDLAEAKGRPPALAEAMVDMNLVVYEVRNGQTGDTAWMSDAEIASSDTPDAWEKIRPVLESRKDHFLELNGKRAVELGLANRTVEGRDDLKEQFPDVEKWIQLKWSRLDTTIMVMNQPFVTGLMFVVGLIALYFEFAAPGLGIGGVVSLICFGLFFWSRFLGGTAEWLDIILFITGFGLLFVELFLIPGFGVWGLAGGLLILIAVITASQPFLVPRTQQELGELTETLTMLMVSIGVFALVAGVMTRRLGSIPGLRRLQLQPPANALEADVPADSLTETIIDGVCVRIGDVGVAESQLRPAGRIRIGHNYVDVVSDGTFVEPEEKVEVINVRGNRIVVRRVG